VDTCPLPLLYRPPCQRHRRRARRRPPACPAAWAT